MTGDNENNLCDEKTYLVKKEESGGDYSCFPSGRNDDVDTKAGVNTKGDYSCFPSGSKNDDNSDSACVNTEQGNGADFPGEQSLLCGADSEEAVEEESAREKYTSCRWTLAMLVCLMNASTHCLRNCLSMALVCMDEGIGRGLQRPMNASGETEATQKNVTSGYTPGTIFSYIPRDEEGLVLSAYFYGYLCTPFVFGSVARRFGATRPVTVAGTLAAVFTFLTPLAIQHGAVWTATLRVLLGVVAGPTVPCATLIWVPWAPQREKAKLVTLSFLGSGLGVIGANLSSGFLCSLPFGGGWPFIFYTYGSVSAVWVMAWGWVAYDSPEEHPRISDKELKLIQKHRASLEASSEVEQKPKVPLTSIFTSGPYLALLTTSVAYIWVLNFLNTYLPLYVHRQLHFSAKTSGVLSSLPSVVALVTGPLAAIVADRIHTGSLLSVTNNRKLFQTTGLAVPCALLFTMGFFPPDDGAIAVVILVAIAAFHRTCSSGFRVNHLDLAPRLTGTLAGITQTFSNLTQIVSVIVISAVIADNLQSDWQTVFVIMGSVSFVGAAVFLLFGSGEQQPWA